MPLSVRIILSLLVCLVNEFIARFLGASTLECYELGLAVFAAAFVLFQEKYWQ